MERLNEGKQEIPICVNARSVDSKLSPIGQVANSCESILRVKSMIASKVGPIYSGNDHL
jgi:hypothetical protein